MRNRIMAAIAAAGMVVTLAACGGGDNTDATKAKAAQASTVDTRHKHSQTYPNGLKVTLVGAEDVTVYTYSEYNADQWDQLLGNKYAVRVTVKLTNTGKKTLPQRAFWHEDSNGVLLAGKNGYPAQPVGFMGFTKYNTETAPTRLVPGTSFTYVATYAVKDTTNLEYDATPSMNYTPLRFTHVKAN